MTVATIIDKELVRQQADGRWVEIISALTGTDISRLNGKNCSCPKCGGIDRFSLVDESRGAVLCRKCFCENNGDGFSAIMWFNGDDFPTAVQKVATYLSIDPTTPATGRKPEPQREEEQDCAKQLELKEWTAENEQNAQQWCNSNPFITVESIKAAGGQIAIFRRDTKVIAIPGYGSDLDNTNPTSWILFNAEPFDEKNPNSGKFAKYKKNEKTGAWEITEWVKVLLTSGSKKGLVIPGGFKHLEATHDILLVEGPKDALSVWSKMSETERGLFSVISTTNGAACNLDSWMLDLFAGKDITIIFDVDDSGVTGAAKYYRKLKQKASSVRVLKLPFPENSKRDLRDFIAEGHNFSDVMKLEQIPESELLESTSPRQNQETSASENSAGQRFEKSIDAIVSVDDAMKQKHNAKRIGCAHKKDKHGKTVGQTLRYLKPDESEICVPMALVNGQWEIGQKSESKPPVDYEWVEKRVDELILSGELENIYETEIWNPLVEIAHDVPIRFAKIRQKLQNTRGRKFSTQTFQRAMKDALAEKKKESAGLSPIHEERYFVQGGVNCKLQKSPLGESFVVQLANFAACIIREITITDGVEQYKAFVIVGRMWNGRLLREVTIRADEFQSLNWIVREWGYEPTVWPQHKLDFAASVQCVSHEVKLSQTFRHTGWFLNELKKWVYLTRSGELSSTGINPETKVELNSPLDRYDLPEPPGGQRQIDAARTVLEILNLGPDRIMFPAFAAPHVAVFGKAKHSMFFFGPTGTLKTSLLGIQQSFFGKNMTAESLPGSWNSTAFALAEKCFLLKDSFFTIDDFILAGTAADIARTIKLGDIVFRGISSGQGRGRAKVDGTLQKERPGRCYTAASGEMLPQGASLLARLLVVEILPDELGVVGKPLSKWTELQNAAADGVFAESMSGFIQWIAPQRSELLKEWDQAVVKTRDEITGRMRHRRTPQAIAEIRHTLTLLFRYFRHIGAISETEEDKYQTRSLAALMEVAGRQQEVQIESDPARRFIRLITAAISSGTAYLVGNDGQAPSDATSWGWHLQDSRSQTGSHQITCRQVSAKRIGWIIGDDIYLIADIALVVAAKLATEQGSQRLPELQTLLQRLVEGEFIIPAEGVRGGNTVRKTIGGKREPSLMHLKTSTIYPKLPDGESDSVSENEPEIDSKAIDDLF